MNRHWITIEKMNRHRITLGVPELATVLELLTAEKFVKMIAFLKSQVCQRVRTNNHVERVNRKLRYEEKSRYKWRTRHTTVRFLVLLMDRYWRRERAIWNRWPNEPKEEQPGDLGSGPPGSVKWHDRASRGCRVQREVSLLGCAADLTGSNEGVIGIRSHLIAA